MRIPVVKLLKKKSYLAMVRNSVQGEVRMFRNLYALVDGQEQDILRDGQVSCAVFVSAILTLNKLVDGPHAVVPSTEKAMAAAGWTQIPDLREGAVVTWEPVTYADGATHWHVGFYMGNNRAISNASNDTGVPKEHHSTYDGKRQIVRIWWHPALDE
jgi:hypothetical protein